MACRIAGISTPARTDLAVLKPFRPATTGPDPMLFSRWLAGLPAWSFGVEIQKLMSEGLLRSSAQTN